MITSRMGAGDRRAAVIARVPGTRTKGTPAAPKSSASGKGKGNQGKARGRAGEAQFTKGPDLTPMPEFMRTGPRTPCADYPDLFVHSSSGQTGATLDRKARAICDRCPFRAPCGEWARDNAQTGTWGGVTYDGRPWVRPHRRKVSELCVPAML